MPSPPLAAHRRAALVVLCLVQFMLVLDDNVVNVALPSIRAELGFGTAGLTWVVNAYFVAFGGLLLLSGRLADLYGRRRVFLTGVALFGAASLACGLAQEPWQLVTGRFAQGTGAALASPAALSLVTLLFTGTAERARALGVWGGIAGLGGTAGLVLSGALTGLTSWRWIFLVNLPFVLAALALLPRLVPESRAAARARLDIPGAVLGTAAVLALTHGLLRGAERWDAAAWGPLTLSAVLAGTFLAVEARTARPLVPPAFLRDRKRAVSGAAMLLFSVAFFAMAFLLMIQLQTVLGYGPLTAGLAYLPYCAGMLTGMWLSPRAVLRFGARTALIPSFALGAAGLALLAGVAPGDGYLSGVLPGMLVTSLGCGLTLPALTVTALSGTTNEDAGLGAALLSTVQQVGGAMGVAVLAGLAARRAGALAGTRGPAEAATAGYALALTAAACAVAAGAVLLAALPRGGRADAGSGTGDSGAGRTDPTERLSPASAKEAGPER